MKKKGITVVFTGDGKGKTSAALGVALRSLGWGGSVLMIQFIKTQKEVGEVQIAGKLKGLEIIQTGEGFYKIGKDLKKPDVHKKAAMDGVDMAVDKMMSGKYDLIVLDEIVMAVSLGLLKEADVLALIENKPEELNLVLTGRGAGKKIIEAASMVTEMKEVKHSFKEGIQAVKGVDY